MSASTDLVPVANMAEIEALDPAHRELAVTNMLAEARSWLAHAVESTAPRQIADFRAFMATVAESTRQLNLSKEIQTDAAEMVRRAERAVGQAVRKGQDDGLVATRGNPDLRPVRDEPKSSRREDLDSPAAYIGDGGRVTSDTYAMTDDVTDERFEEAIAEAKAEGNLSRANVVRKVKATSPAGRAEPRRSALPEQARKAGWELRKAVERVERIAADDRFDTNQEQMATHLRSHLTHAVEVCQDLLDRIPPPKETQ